MSVTIESEPTTNFADYRPSGELCQDSKLVYASHCNGRHCRGNVYLLKNGAKSFGDGIQDICKDTESNLGPVTGF